MVAHPGFDLFFAALVAANTLFMGIDVELSLANQSGGLASEVLGKTFTFAFTATRLWHAPCTSAFAFYVRMRLNGRRCHYILPVRQSFRASPVPE